MPFILATTCLQLVHNARSTAIKETNVVFYKFVKTLVLSYKELFKNKYVFVTNFVIYFRESLTNMPFILATTCLQLVRNARSAAFKETNVVFYHNIHILGRSLTNMLFILATTCISTRMESYNQQFQR